MNTLQGKHIVFGITGSIAAYKACYIIRGLIKRGAEVQVVITPAGKEFITPVTLSTLTSKPVITEFFSSRDGSWHSHVDLGLWADAMLVAPATASTIGKMANGIADNMLVTTYLSAKEQVFVAPAMDLDMFRHPSTQRNLETLRQAGDIIIEPAAGELASHLVGKGRMEEPEEIIRHLELYFAHKEGDLRGKTVLITVGPTHEKMDPVRFIGNYSSGKMGMALADECTTRGARVILIAGPATAQPRHTPHLRIDVESAEQMYQATLEQLPQADIAIMAAAVADYRPIERADQKIKREDKADLQLQLTRNPDIAAAVGAYKAQSSKPLITVGFALETQDGLTHAHDKLIRKQLDFMVLNSLQDKGAGFGTDTNKVTIIGRDTQQEYSLKTKAEVAADIINTLLGKTY